MKIDKIVDKNMMKNCRQKQMKNTLTKKVPEQQNSNVTVTFYKQLAKNY